LGSNFGSNFASYFDKDGIVRWVVAGLWLMMAEVNTGDGMNWGIVHPVEKGLEEGTVR